MRQENNDEFNAFCERYGNEIATGILEDICCLVTSDSKAWRVHISGRETHDLEGANATITGDVCFRAKCWDFVVDSGNWNGTVVKAWERCAKAPCVDQPAQSVWLFAPVDAFITGIIVKGMTPQLSSMTATFFGKGKS